MNLDKTGLLNKIVKSVESIDLGRKGLAKTGATEKGLRFFSKGLLSALAVFKEVYDNAGDDIETALRIEHAYQTEERRYCSENAPRYKTHSALRASTQ